MINNSRFSSMGENMIKSAIAMLSVTAMSLSAFAQESSVAASTTSPAAAAENSTTGTLSDSKQDAVKSPWGAGVLLLVNRPSRVKEDAEAKEYDTQMHFSGKYRFSPSDKIEVVQRLNRSISVSGREDLEKFSLANLRIQETHTRKLLGADFALLSRVTLPTVLESRRDAKMIGALTFIPDLSWAVTPKVNVGYTGSFLGIFYGDKTEVKEVDGVKTAKTLNGGERTTLYMINQGYVQYSFTDKLMFSQALGLGHGSDNSNNSLTKLSQTARTVEASSAFIYSPTKTVALTMAMNQSAPLAEKSVDAGGSVLDYEKDVVPFARDQTTYEFTGSVSF